MPDAPPIPQAELARLIKLLGMLGSNSEGERSNAALLADKWVREHSTDWTTLLTPPAEPNPVVSVGVAGDTLDIDDAYRRGYRAGINAGYAQAGSVHAASQNWGGGLNAGNPFAATFNAAQQAAHPAPPPAPTPAPTGQQATWKAAAQAMLFHYSAFLRGQKEQDFITGLLQKNWPKLTDKQADWLRDICARASLTW
jgi:hypothetical protein